MCPDFPHSNKLERVYPIQTLQSISDNKTLDKKQTICYTQFSELVPTFSHIYIN